MLETDDYFLKLVYVIAHRIALLHLELVKTSCQRDLVVHCLVLLNIVHASHDDSAILILD